MGRNYKRQREQMWRRNPRCYWCGRHTRLLNINGGLQPPDMATIDHLFSRINEDRRNHSAGIWKVSHSGNPYVVRRVLACYACNSERGRRETKLTHLREQQSKSGTTSLYTQSYEVRHRRLAALKQRAERDVFGLIGVMGWPLRGGTAKNDEKSP